MKLISLKQAQQILDRQLKNKAPIETTLYTFKQDRYISFFCLEDGLHIEESGYRTQKAVISDPNMWKRALKEALKTEFPRSRNVYIKKAEK